MSRVPIITNWEPNFCGYGKLHLLPLPKCGLTRHLIGSERCPPPSTTDLELPVGPKVWESSDMHFLAYPTPLAMIAGSVMVPRKTLSVVVHTSANQGAWKTLGRVDGNPHKPVSQCPALPI